MLHIEATNRTEHTDDAPSLSASAQLNADAKKFKTEIQNLNGVNTNLLETNKLSDDQKKILSPEQKKILADALTSLSKTSPLNLTTPISLPLSAEQIALLQKVDA
jgi:hypothetical protein